MTSVPADEVAADRQPYRDDDESRHFGAVEYFVSNPIRLDQSWNSYKIASRHGYIPEDWGIWSDLIRLLDRCGRDIRSTRYICPTDLTTEHDKWLDKVTSAEEKHKSKGQLIRAKEEDFLKSKSCYFGIVISDKDIEVSVLDSIEAVKPRGRQCTTASSSVNILRKKIQSCYLPTTNPATA